MYIYKRKAANNTIYYYLFKSVWDKNPKKYIKKRFYLGKKPVLTEELEKLIEQSLGKIPSSIQSWLNSFPGSDTAKVKKEIIAKKLFTLLFFLLRHLDNYHERNPDNHVMVYAKNHCKEACHLVALLTKKKTDKKGRVNIKFEELQMVYTELEKINDSIMSGINFRERGLYIEQLDSITGIIENIVNAHFKVLKNNEFPLLVESHIQLRDLSKLKLL